MKVGTDGVLLGAWAKISSPKAILDIGTGSGLLALMLAQRTNTNVYVDAVELELQDSQQAEENVRSSPWHDRITVHHTAIQDFTPGKSYDLIVSNPPYFRNSLQPPERKRLLSRHSITLSFEDLVTSVKRMIKPSGIFCVILPYAEGLDFIQLAKEQLLHCNRQWSFRTREEKPIERWLLEFSPTRKAPETGEILLYKDGQNWSDEYKNLTHYFYLKPPDEKF
jgi:tRNA1Val (adenine37-N6)-methyltransferase